MSPSVLLWLPLLLRLFCCCCCCCACLSVACSALCLILVTKRCLTLKVSSLWIPLLFHFIRLLVFLVLLAFMCSSIRCGCSFGAQVAGDVMKWNEIFLHWRYRKLTFFTFHIFSCFLQHFVLLLLFWCVICCSVFELVPSNFTWFKMQIWDFSLLQFFNFGIVCLYWLPQCSSATKFHLKYWAFSWICNSLDLFVLCGVQCFCSSEIFGFPKIVCTYITSFAQLHATHLVLSKSHWCVFLSSIKLFCAYNITCIFTLLAVFQLSFIFT